MEEKRSSVFATLSAINVNGHTEKKNGLTYLSWAWAWAELLKHYPDSTYTVYENRDGLCYHTDGRTAWVKTGVTVEGTEFIEMLPVMDSRNRSIPLENVTSMDANKAIQRSLTKAVARHGLGLYIYAGEDLPESEDPKKSESEEEERGYIRQVLLGLGEKMGDADGSRTKAFAEACVEKATGRKVVFEDLSSEQLQGVKLELVRKARKKEGADVRDA